jgi:hypothetical protein
MDAKDVADDNEQAVYQCKPCSQSLGEAQSRTLGPQIARMDLWHMPMHLSLPIDKFGHTQYFIRSAIHIKRIILTLFETLHKIQEEGGSPTTEEVP